MRNATVQRRATASALEVRSAKEPARRIAVPQAAADLPDRLGLGYGIARLARLIARDATRRLGEELGLTLAEWRLLLLMQSDQQAHLDELADRALLEKSHASIAATGLIAKKLARRAASPGDRRRVLFSRTALGTRAVETYLAVTARERAALWGVLTATEQDALRDYLARLLDAAETSVARVANRRPYRPRRRTQA
jgi:DNA-binding MarR family transcriptional regulator